MTDLYDVLDVPKDADKAEIRRAYRKKAKATHPDNSDTGNAKSFALVKLAHDVLTDEQRRAQYDKTGEYGEKAPENPFADAMNLISNALDEVMNDIAKNAGIDMITSFNLIARMIDSLVKYRGTALKNKENSERVRSVNQKILHRFKRRHKSDEQNMMEAMISARIAACGEQMAFQDRNVKAATQAIEILREYEFETERANTHPPPAMFVIEAMLRGRALGG
jgi:curved DNA-binding protein CbpA